MDRLNFLCDPRVQLLSAQEESFLFRLFEARLRNDLQPFGGRFPTDPKLLRPIAYPHKPGPRDSFLQCLIAKLEQVRIATMIPPAPCAVFDLPRYLPVQSGEIIAFDAPSSSGTEVIHIDGPGPPKKPNQIAVVAAAAADSFSLKEKLKPFYPRHDLEHEWRDYVTHQRKAKKQCYAVSDNPKVFTFLKWMEKAAVPIKPSRMKIEKIDSQSELDFAEPADPKFMAEFESRKARRAS